MDLNKISDLGAKARIFFLRYKFRVAFVGGTLAWVGLLRIVLPFTTALTRLLLISSFTVLFFGWTLAFTQLFTAPISFSIDTFLYNRKHAPELTDFPELYEVAEKMGYPYSKKIKLTDNPNVDSAYTNMNTGEITLPRSWKERFTFEQLLSILAHEVGHLKTRKRSWMDMLWVIGGTALSALLLGFLVPTVFAQIGGLSVFYLLLIIALQRNEFRADEEAAKVLGPDHLIEVFKDFDSDSRFRDGSESHPSPMRRIRRLRHLFLSKR